jgi:hypothetical protein
MRDLLPASRVQPLVMTASKRRREHPEFHAVAFRRHNAGHQRRAARSTLHEGNAVRRVRCMPLLGRDATLK